VDQIFQINTLYKILRQKKWKKESEENYKIRLLMWEKYRKHDITKKVYKYKVYKEKSV